MREVDLKIIILGGMGVGKTSLLQRYIHNVFYEEYRSTLGASVQSKTIKMDGHVVRMQVWDTGGQERFHSMVSFFYKGLDGCVLTFDLTDRDTFTELKRWRQDVLDKSCVSGADIPFIILGNKVDVGDRQVSCAEVQSWCKDRNIPYLEVSAKDNVNVEKAFTVIARQALGWHKEKLASCMTDSIKLRPDDRVKTKCC